jgi:hypothetical protein
MRVAYEYSHLGGKEILQVRFPKILREIRELDLRGAEESR